MTLAVRAIIAGAILLPIHAYSMEGLYLIPDQQEGGPVSILPNDEGLAIRSRNVGQTPVVRYAVQVWLLKEGVDVSIEVPPTQVPQRNIDPNQTVTTDLRWPYALHDFEHFRGGFTRAGLLWRVISQDSSRAWHCEAFAANYRPPSVADAVPEGFTEVDAPPVCDRKVRSVRLKRACIFSPEDSSYAFGEKWEWFPEVPLPLLPPNKSDFAPCVLHTK